MNFGYAPPAALKKNDYLLVDELIYKIRQCAVDNGNNCGVSCECRQNKEKLLEMFNPLFFHLLESPQAIYGCYTQRDDFEQELKTKFLELIYSWDDNYDIGEGRTMFFVTYSSIMLHKWILKMSNAQWLWNKRKIDNYLMYDVDKYDKDFDKSLNEFYSKEYIQNMSKHLTDKQRAVLEDRFISNLMVNEIAVRHDVSPGAISNLLKRAYKTLVEILEDQED